jgi:hypothetical protein
VIDLLVKKGADPMRLDGSGRSPFIRALRNHIEAAEKSEDMLDQKVAKALAEKVGCFRRLKFRRSKFWRSSAAVHSAGTADPEETGETKSFKSIVETHFLTRNQRAGSVIASFANLVDSRKEREKIKAQQDAEKSWSQIEYMSEADSVVRAINLCGYVRGLGMLVPSILVLCLFVLVSPNSSASKFSSYQALEQQLQTPLSEVQTVQGWCDWMHESIMCPSLLNSVRSNLVGSIKLEKQIYRKCPAFDSNIKMVTNWPHALAIGKSCPESEAREAAWDGSSVKHLGLGNNGQQQFHDVCNQWYKIHPGNSSIVPKNATDSVDAAVWLDPETTAALRVSFTTYDSVQDQFAVVQFESDVNGIGGKAMTARSFIFLFSWNPATQCKYAPLCFSFSALEANFGWVLILAFTLVASGPFLDLLSCAYHFKKLRKWCFRHMATLVLICILVVLFWLNFVINNELDTQRVDLSYRSEVFIDFMPLASRMKLRKDLVAAAAASLALWLLLLTETIPNVGPTLKAFTLTATQDEVFGSLLLTLCVVLAFTFALYTASDGRLAPFKTMFEGFQVMLRVGFGDIEPLYSSEATSVWAATIGNELMFTSLLLTYFVFVTVSYFVRYCFSYLYLHLLLLTYSL